MSLLVLSDQQGDGLGVRSGERDGDETHLEAFACVYGVSANEEGILELERDCFKIQMSACVMILRLGR